MPSGLGKFVDILGDDFDLVIDSFRGSMTPEIENMLMSTMDSMLFDTNMKIFKLNLLNFKLTV